jgi:hypothetical protein
VNVKVKSQVVSPGTTGVSRHHQRSSDTTSDREAPPDDFEGTPETLAESGLEADFVDHENVPEQTLKNSVNRSGLTTKEDLNKEKTGTSPRRLVEEAGIPLNAALLSVLEQLEQSNPESAYERVRNAVSAYEERKEAILNPQAFMSAALRRGFTSNTAKRQKRTQTEKQKKTNFPPAPADLSDVIADITLQCQRLEMTPREAVERFGRKGRSLSDLSEMDLATLRREMAEW